MDQLFKIVFMVLAAIISAGWAYLILCVKQIMDIYKLKAERAVEEAEFFRKRIEGTLPLIDVWEKSIQKMQQEFKKAERKLGESTSQRIELSDQLKETLESLERLRENKDSLSKLVLEIDTEEVWLRPEQPTVRRELIREVLEREVLEDLALIEAIKEGQGSESVSRDEIFSLLDRKS